MSDEPTEEEKELFSSLSKLMEKYKLDFIDVSAGPGGMYVMKSEFTNGVIGVCSY